MYRPRYIWPITCRAIRNILRVLPCRDPHLARREPPRMTVVVARSPRTSLPRTVVSPSCARHPRDSRRRSRITIVNRRPRAIFLPISRLPPLLESRESSHTSSTRDRILCRRMCGCTVRRVVLCRHTRIRVE